MADRIPLSAIELGYVECGNGGRADSHGYLHAGDTDITVDGEGAADLADDIFRACNAHDDLLAALKALRTRFHKACVELGTTPEYVAFTTPDADAAIAKAEGL